MNQSYITIFSEPLCHINYRRVDSCGLLFVSVNLSVPDRPYSFISDSSCCRLFGQSDRIPPNDKCSGRTCFFLLAAFGVLTILVAEIVTGTAYLAKTLPPHISTFISYCEKLFTTHIQPLYNELTLLFQELETNQQASIVTHIQTLGDSAAKNAGLLLSHILEMIPRFSRFFPIRRRF